MKRTTKIVGLAGVLSLLMCLHVRAATAAAESWSRDDAAHLLRLAGFGGTPEQIDRIHAMGKAAAVEYLLNDPTTKPTTQPIFPKVDLPSLELSKKPANQKTAHLTSHTTAHLLPA